MQQEALGLDDYKGEQKMAVFGKIKLAVSATNKNAKVCYLQFEKKWQAPHIAPLQPPILAVFLPWGGSAGAGRVRPARCKCRVLK